MLWMFVRDYSVVLASIFYYFRALGLFVAGSAGRLAAVKSVGGIRKETGIPGVTGFHAKPPRRLPTV